MTNFTGSPLERFMQQPPRAYREVMSKPPIGSVCRGCSYWRGIKCGLCYKELNTHKKTEEATSGQIVPKSG